MKKFKKKKQLATAMCAKQKRDPEEAGQGVRLHVLMGKWQEGKVAVHRCEPTITEWQLAA